MNKSFKRTKFNIYKWKTTITVTSSCNLRVGTDIALGGTYAGLITRINGNTITIFNKG